MKVAKSGKLDSPSTRALKLIAKENGLNTNHIKEATITTKPMKWHEFIDGNTGKKTSLNSRELVDLGNEWIKQITFSDQPLLFQTFWSSKGIPLNNLDSLAKSEPEFKERLAFGKQLIAEKWAAPLMQDIYTIRARAAVYIKEWRDYDKELALAKELIKQELQEEQNRKDEENKTVIVNMVDYGDKETSLKDSRVKDTSVKDTSVKETK
jgi:hypothetical protein